MAIEPSPIRGLPGDEKEHLATAFASARVKDPGKREQSFEPMYGEIDYEMRVMDGESRAGGIVYDGGKLGNALMHLLPNNDLRTAHIVMTDRLVSTFSEEDLRHHLRTLVAGFPTLVSVPGIVEAPAKPREYHVRRQALELMGASMVELESLKRSFRRRYIDYDDPRTPKVIMGLALQAVLYHLTLDPFCCIKHCRFYNAHWQEDLIRSQVKPDGLCPKHSKQMRALGREPVIAWL